MKKIDAAYRALKEARHLVELNVDEAEKIRMLLRRDEPMQAIPYEWEYKGEKHKALKCPECGEIIGKRDRFCSGCGQRIDEEYVAIC